MNLIILASLGLSIMMAYTWIKIIHATRKYPVMIPLRVYSNIQRRDRIQSINETYR